MRLVNILIIARYAVMNYSLLMPYMVAFYAKRNDILKKEFNFALEVSFSIFLVLCFNPLHSERLKLLTILVL